MLEARQEMRRRTDGCIRAWVSRSMDGQPMFLLQAIYENEEAWHRSAKRVSDELDPRDGGIESLLGGPPWSAFLLWTRKTSIWRAPSCRITYIMRHGFRVVLSKCSAVRRIELMIRKDSNFYT